MRAVSSKWLFVDILKMPIEGVAVPPASKYVTAPGNFEISEEFARDFRFRKFQEHPRNHATLSDGTHGNLLWNFCTKENIQGAGRQG